MNPPSALLDSMQVLRENLSPRGWALDELARRVAEGGDAFTLEHLAEERPVLVAMALEDALGMLAERLQEREP